MAARKKEKKEIFTEKTYTNPMIVAQVMLGQSLLGAAGASGAAQVNLILALGGGIEDIINPVRAKLGAITYDFSSNFFPKFKVMHFQNGDIKLYTVVLLFLCFLKILTKLCCRWSRNRGSTFNNCRVREFQIPDRRAQ